MVAKDEQKIPRPLSPGEEAFALHCRVEGLTPVREFVFYPPRKWRLDFYFPEWQLGVEIEGGLREFGRHQQPGGFAKDCEKYNAATLAGIKILRYTTKMVFDGTAILEVLRALKNDK